MVVCMIYQKIIGCQTDLIKIIKKSDESIPVEHLFLGARPETGAKFGPDLLEILRYLQKHGILDEDQMGWHYKISGASDLV